MNFENTLRPGGKNRFWQNKKILILLIFVIGLFLDLLSWSLILVRFWNFDQSVALHTNILFGFDSVGPWRKLLILPLLGLGVLIVHFFLTFYFLSQRKMVGLLVISLLIIQLILLSSVLVIINL